MGLLAALGSQHWLFASAWKALPQIPWLVSYGLVPVFLLQKCLFWPLSTQGCLHTLLSPCLIFFKALTNSLKSAQPCTYFRSLLLECTFGWAETCLALSSLVLCCHYRAWQRISVQRVSINMSQWINKWSETSLSSRTVKCNSVSQDTF